MFLFQQSMRQIVHRDHGRLIPGTPRERFTNHLPSFVFAIEK
jgi:hypothetical protein